jgi:hypothetical protein
MRTLAVNEIEEVGGGPAWFAPPIFWTGIKWAAAAFTAAFVVGAGEELGSQAVQNATGTSCPKPTG